MLFCRSIFQKCYDVTPSDILEQLRRKQQKLEESLLSQSHHVPSVGDGILRREYEEELKKLRSESNSQIEEDERLAMELQKEDSERNNVNQTQLILKDEEYAKELEVEIVKPSDTSTSSASSNNITKFFTGTSPRMSTPTSTSMTNNTTSKSNTTTNNNIFKNITKKKSITTNNNIENVTKKQKLNLDKDHNNDSSVWSCKVCTFLNHHLIDTCEMCETGTKKDTSIVKSSPIKSSVYTKLLNHAQTTSNSISTFNTSNVTSSSTSSSSSTAIHSLTTINQ
jgi:hypothetical protein